MREVGGGDQALAGEIGAQKGERVALQSQAQARVIGTTCSPNGISGSSAMARASLSCAAKCRHAAASERRMEAGTEASSAAAKSGSAGSPNQGPQRAAAIEPDRAEGVRFGEALERAAAETAAPPKRSRIRVAMLRSRGAEPLRIRLGEPLYLTQAEARRPFSAPRRFQRAIPGTVVDIDWRTSTSCSRASRTICASA